MDPEKTAGLLVLGWLVGVLFLISASIRRGRDLADSLAARHPERYEALGRPRPGFFHSARRTQFALFIARREYERLSDPPLAARFEAHRRSEARLLLFFLLSLGGIALLVVAVRHAS